MIILWLVPYLGILLHCGKKGLGQTWPVKCFYNRIDGEMSLKERVAMIGKHLFGQVKHYRRNSFPTHTKQTLERWTMMLEMSRVWIESYKMHALHIEVIN
jgi:hypothetical protein